MEPSASIERSRGSESSRSRSSHAAHDAFSSVVGLLAGGAHRTAATIRSPVSICPSPEATDVGWLA